jgi:signal transduction histidine kinase
MNIGEAWRTTSVRWSVTIALVLLVQSSILSGLFYWWTVRSSVGEVDSGLVSDCMTLENLKPRALAFAVDQMVAADVHRTTLAGVFDAQGRVLAGNIAALPAALTTQSHPMVVGLIRTHPPSTIADQNRAIACPTPSGGHVVFAYDMDELRYIHGLIERALMLVTVPAILVAVVLGIFLSWRAQSHFRKVQAAVEDVMGGRLQRRLPVRSSFDPFDRLSSSVNTMLDRLEEAVDDLRALGDDIAHELRTPLTRLRARLERGYQDAKTAPEFHRIGERALQDIDHALSIVSSILRIREIDEGKRGANFGQVNVAELVHDAADLYAPSAEMRHIALHIDAGRAAYVVGDHDLLMEAICNLVDNAIKFTPVGGEVRCSLKNVGDKATSVRVVDTGPGIAQHHRDAVFRRFHRGAEHSAIPGHGIGLSLVAAIVRLHGFSLQIRNAGPGFDISINCGDSSDFA